MRALISTRWRWRKYMSIAKKSVTTLPSLPVGCWMPTKKPVYDSSTITVPAVPPLPSSRRLMSSPSVDRHPQQCVSLSHVPFLGVALKIRSLDPYEIAYGITTFLAPTLTRQLFCLACHVEFGGLTGWDWESPLRSEEHTSE